MPLSVPSRVRASSCTGPPSFSKTRSDHYHSNKATVGSFNDGPRINDRFFNGLAQPDEVFCLGWQLPSCTYLHAADANWSAVGTWGGRVVVFVVDPQLPL